MGNIRGSALRAQLICGVAGIAVLTAAAAFSAQAQTVEAATAAPAQDDSTVVVVTGVRASMQNAAKLKRNSAQIQESVTAEDIGKMPDNNVAESLQRLTGVQVNRDLGEGQYVAIRGLTQVQSEMNGRPIFSANGDGRTLNYESVPSELLAGADVYKSPMADQVDGGIGGLVNFRTRRPFDFKGLKVAGSVEGRYGDQVKRPSYSKSLLLSDRWSTSIGEIGALLSVSDQTRDFQRNFNKNADFKAHTIVDGSGNNLFPDKTCTIAGSAPGSVCMSEADYEQPDIGYRNRVGVTGALQWKPNDYSEYYLDYTGTDFKSTEKVLGSFPCPVCASSIVASDVTFLPGRPNDVASATYYNVPIINDNYYGSSHARDRQISVGGIWNLDKWKLDAEVTTAKTTNRSFFSLLEQQAIAPQMKYDITTQPSTFSFPGFDLTDPANWHYTGVNVGPSFQTGEQSAVKWDAQYKSEGWLQSVKFGMRLADEKHAADSVSNWSGVTNTRIDDVSIPIGVSTHTQLFDSIPSKWVGPQIDALANPDYIYAVFGLTAPREFDPHNHYDIDEKTVAAYVMADFEGTIGVPYSGNFGVRYVSTEDNANGWQTSSDTLGNTTYTPFHTKSDYTDILPSLNVKFNLQDDLILRLAASKVVTRPGFPSLNPTVSLSPFFQTAAGGNPNLKPLRADQLDSSLEWYFSSTGYLYGAVFYKKVQNFIFTSNDNEVFNGVTYLTSHPANGASGNISGLELGYQQFFDNGFGIIANTTFLDPQTPSGIAGYEAPLPQLSKVSYNLIGVYEKGPFSFRLAYNWRDKFIETLSGNNGGIQPEYRKAYGILDLSASYKLNDNWSVTVQGQNLTQPLRATYYTIEPHTAETQTEDTYYSVGLRFNY